ncbi:MAG: ATP-binding cassette domain-containing protein, partial [Pontibacterium sp.]
MTMPTSPLNEQAILSVRNLSVAFGDTNENTVKGISFDLHKSRTLALVGESGSGKSLSALSVLKLLPYPHAKHPSGEIRFAGQNLLTLSEKEMRTVRGNRISMIFQEPMTSLNPLHTVERQIGEAIGLHTALTGKAVRARVLELLNLVGIPNPQSRLKSFPHELSGGQRQRVMIAMALANEPEILIADEPTTALDVTIQEQILQLLSDLQTKLGMAILLITHDLNIVRRYAHHVCVMQQGKIVESGDCQSLFQSPQHCYTQTLIDAEPEGSPQPIKHDAQTLLKAEQLKVWFPIRAGLLKRVKDHVKALNPIDIAIKQGETLGIVGESGSGKTTLGMALLR